MICSNVYCNLFLQTPDEIPTMSSEADQVQNGLPPTKKAKKVKTNMEEADRAQSYLLPAREQPGRVLLGKMGFAGKNRGGQGILPMHVHSVALDVCTNGTSKRRYNVVLLVVVPQKELQAWRAENAFKMSSKSTLSEVQRQGHRVRYDEVHSLCGC